jgi:hypothetical protein
MSTDSLDVVVLTHKLATLNPSIEPKSHVLVVIQ